MKEYALLQVNKEGGGLTTPCSKTKSSGNMRNIFFALIASAIFFSCQNESGSTKLPSDLTEAEGYSYKIHIDAEGAPAEIGELSIFDIVQRFDDTIVYQSSQRGRSEKIVIPDATKMGGRKMSPIIEFLSKLSPGDSGSVYIPVDSLPGNVPDWQLNREFLIYDISVKEVKNLKEKENEIATKTADLLAAYKAGTLELTTLDSGLKYHVVEEGTGVQAENSKQVLVNYFGVLTSDGSMFDNSFNRGEPFRFPLGAGRVIKGWDLGIAELKKGAKAILFIPSDLGYGKAGSPPKIPADSELAFYVELVDVI